MPMPTRLRFLCPRCGTFSFGTFTPSLTSRPNKQIRQCNGYAHHLGRTCQFQWSEDNDYMYFVQVFTTREQYDAARMSEQGLVGTAVKQ